MDIATLVVVVLVIAVALTFDFTNGFHDTANAMATSIATGALKPKTAQPQARPIWQSAQRLLSLMQFTTPFMKWRVTKPVTARLSQAF